jgi:hypothetical protein
LRAMVQIAKDMEMKGTRRLRVLGGSAGQRQGKQSVRGNALDRRRWLNRLLDGPLGREHTD